MKKEMLKEQVKERIEGLEGHLGVYYKNLCSQESFLIISEGLQDRFYAASVIKMPIMVEVFRQMEEGSLSGDRKIQLKKEDKVPAAGAINYAEEQRQGKALDELLPESGILNCMHDGLELTVMDLCTLMIVISDNTATNLLIDLLGKDRINQTMKELGLEKTKLNRKLFEAATVGQESENYISLEEMGLLLEKIYSGTLISARASEEMERILVNQQFNYKIPFYLTHLPVAHKTGEDVGITNDVGVVYDNEPFILCLAANDTDVPETERQYQEIAKLCASVTPKEQ